jgi:hypothetical protein
MSRFAEAAVATDHLALDCALRNMLASLTETHKTRILNKLIHQTFRSESLQFGKGIIGFDC